MKLEVIQYTLKCKEELDVILESIDKIRVLLFDNNLDEVYAATVRELSELRRSTHRAIENLNKGCEELLNARGL